MKILMLFCLLLILQSCLILKAKIDDPRGGGYWIVTLKTNE